MMLRRTPQMLKNIDITNLRGQDLEGEARNMQLDQEDTRHKLMTITFNKRPTQSIRPDLPCYRLSPSRRVWVFPISRGFLPSARLRWHVNKVFHSYWTSLYFPVACERRRISRCNWLLPEIRLRSQANFHGATLVQGIRWYWPYLPVIGQLDWTRG